MEIVRWEQRPQLRQPMLIAAFSGWNDAGEAATTAARYLAAEWGAKPFATLDPEEFYDFTSVRPQVRLVDGITRQIDWPSIEISAAPVPGAGRDAVFLVAPEPQLRWRTFCASILGVTSAVGVEMSLTLGALLTDIPHSRPTRLTGTTTDKAMAERFGFVASRYEGPTGIVGALQDAFGRAGVPAASLWATVPHYVQQVLSPKAALALVLRAAELVGGRVDPLDLREAGDEYERQVNERLVDDEEATAYVRTLEEAYDSETRTTVELPLPSADTLAAEAERFLRDQGD